MGRQVKRLYRITTVDIFAIHHLKLLDARNQERLIQTIEFQKAWDKSTIIERKQILFWLRKIKPNKIKEYIREKVYGGLESLPIIQLRQLASHYHIKNYSRKSRAQVIKEIKGKQNGSKRRKK